MQIYTNTYPSQTPIILDGEIEHAVLSASQTAHFLALRKDASLTKLFYILLNSFGEKLRNIKRADQTKNWEEYGVLRNSLSKVPTCSISVIKNGALGKIQKKLNKIFLKNKLYKKENTFKAEVDVSEYEKTQSRYSLEVFSFKEIQGLLLNSQKYKEDYFTNSAFKENFPFIYQAIRTSSLVQHYLESNPGKDFSNHLWMFSTLELQVDSENLCPTTTYMIVYDREKKDIINQPVYLLHTDPLDLDKLLKCTAKLFKKMLLKPDSSFKKYMSNFSLFFSQTTPFLCGNSEIEQLFYKFFIQFHKSSLSWDATIDRSLLALQSTSIGKFAKKFKTFSSSENQQKRANEKTDSNLPKLPPLHKKNPQNKHFK